MIKTATKEKKVDIVVKNYKKIKVRLNFDIFEYRSYMYICKGI